MIPLLHEIILFEVLGGSFSALFSQDPLGAPKMEQKRSVRVPRGTERLKNDPRMPTRGPRELQKWPKERPELTK